MVSFYQFINIEYISFLNEYKLICTFEIWETPLEFFDPTLYKFFVWSIWIDCNVTVNSKRVDVWLSPK